MDINWMKVAAHLDGAARLKQDEANAEDVSGSKYAARAKDEAASILRALARALRAGTY